ncbi:hypothetical protein, variant [Blastomyces gilchristii SLH14081]|uniref:T6SS Phospholipase effector Tle1-like catalytic domain-containing protein n=1 Tax=Blastomyces gilchristii (strain SLH14081) TaxID=559298 RepID=A0A179UUJ3_BLAGS|nr:uncharacterized protein BDBG_06550 [Blastomyces gilchristii SLH14081]XP_031579484.1 hypothetical protein, variant [Blastomyces gilchristii SLH14081]OAT10746.1 hypothetical protein BDBG_06550 [Blastomyces gilchristii SLH14081]OAT10747.1 hypothetical protein, variant [Blastomyces gilchristii SLH14081]
MSHYALDLPKTFVLCFDGTGNKFTGDESDSNVLKIFRMLDRNQGQQFHYYQPGIGTYVTSTKVPSHAGTFSRIKRSWIKAKDAAIGSSFDHHVLAGYRFLMRYYSPGDEIFFFGFSRGAYIARFLAEMLDYVGLLTIGNEELVLFAWKTFSKWQQRTGTSEADIKKRHDLYNFMTAFRETFSRPIQRIRFLGLFDTVNSIPKFESPWMSRNRFPYTARSSAKIIRHAVGIDERRAKFRQDLISQSQHCHHSHYRRRFSFIPRRFFHERKNLLKETIEVNSKSGAGKSETKVMGNTDAKPSKHLSATGWTQPREENRYRPLYPRRSMQNLRTSAPDNHNFSTDGASCADSIVNLPLQTQHITDDRSVQSDQTVQDIEEVWFPGCHADIGGGWGLMPSEKWPLSHAPLVWMVHEAQRAGLQFDERKLKKFECAIEFSGDYSPIHKSWSPDQDKRPNPPDIVINGVDDLGIQDAPQDNPANSPSSRSFYDALNYSGTQGHIHDSLDFKSGLSAMSVLAWNMMEYLPFKRMDLQQDGSWAPIRWPLPCGEVRDIPVDAKIHNTAIQRLKANENYRPGNLIIGGGGRGVRIAPKDMGVGEWVISGHEGDQVRETYVRANISTCASEKHRKQKTGAPKNGTENNGPEKNGTQTNGT